jgi:hypothetical protein
MGFKPIYHPGITSATAHFQVIGSLWSHCKLLQLCVVAGLSP